jgi:hypothetical protein
MEQKCKMIDRKEARKCAKQERGPVGGLKPDTLVPLTGLAAWA